MPRPEHAQRAYQGYSMDEVGTMLEKLIEDFDKYGEDRLPYERLEARVESAREQFKNLFDAEDDGTMPTEAQALIGQIQRFENLRR